MSLPLLQFLTLFSLVCYVRSIEAVSFIERCKLGDRACMTKSANAALPIVADGIPAIGVPSGDPLLIKLIQTEQNGLKVKFANIFVTGIKNCDFKSLLLEKTKFDFELNCKLVMKGDYELGGKLLILPIEGDGPFTVEAQKLNINVTGEVTEKKSGEGKSYYKVTSFKHNTEALAPIIFDFKNLYNGNKELSEATVNFANTNYKEILREIGQPILNEIITDIIKIVNKVFKNIPADEIFLN